MTARGPPSDPVDQPDGARRGGLTDAIRAEQVRLLTVGRIDLPANLLIAVIVAVSVGHFYPVWVAPAWLGAVCLAVLARYGLRRHVRGLAGHDEDARRWGVWFTVAAGATGCLWGLTGSVILVTTDPTYQIFIIFVLGGMMAGGVVGAAAYRPALFAFMAPAILPVIGALLSHRHFMQIEMGLMLMAFALVLSLAGNNIGASLVENLGVRLTQERLSTRLAAGDLAMAQAQALAHVGSWQFDARTNVSVWSDELFHILGFDPRHTTPSLEAFVARIHPDDRPAFEQVHADWVSTGSDRPLDHRLVMDDGQVKWVHEFIRTSHDAEGRPEQMVGIMQDITLRKAAQERLEFTSIVLETQMEASPEGVLIVDVTGRIIAHNRRFAEITQIPRTELEGGRDAVVMARVSASIVRPGDFSDRIRRFLERPDDSGGDELETADGTMLDFHTEPLRPTGGERLGRVWLLRDITERKRAEALALRMARFDALTGLANRAAFVDAVNHAIAVAKRGGAGFAIVYLDLDHFKDVNDTLGHPLGDELLKAVADRLRSVLQGSDIIARFGGDEFALIAADIAQPREVAPIAEMLIAAIAEPFTVKGNPIHTSASIGIDIYGPGESDAETLLSHADVALYRAKAEGRAAYRFFTGAMDHDMRSRATLGAELQQALAGGELLLLYQPQIDVQTGRITGLEALVRWRHPSRGVLAPRVFLPVAEQMGLAVKLGHWVLLTACRQAVAWSVPGAAPPRICVNLSAQQFRAPLEFEADIAAILAETGLPAQRLELELTETVLMDVARENNDVLARLRATGVTISIDEFGTGYSSLDYLRRFPAKRIKIAQTFIRNVETTPGDASIVRATIGLGRDLGIMVIAEGVERSAQFELLKNWGCGEVAGFFFARPLLAEDITRLLRQGGSIAPHARLVEGGATATDETHPFKA